MIKYIAYHNSVMSGIVPFKGRSSAVGVKSSSTGRQKVLGGITARALAYG